VAGRGEGELQRMLRTQRRNRHVTVRSRMRESRTPGSAGGEEQSSSLPRPSPASERCNAALVQCRF